MFTDRFDPDSFDRELKFVSLSSKSCAPDSPSTVCDPLDRRLFSLPKDGASRFPDLLEVEEDGSRKSPRRDDAFSPFDGSGSFFLLLDFEVFDLESLLLKSDESRSPSPCIDGRGRFLLRFEDFLLGTESENWLRRSISPPKFI